MAATGGRSGTFGCYPERHGDRAGTCEHGAVRFPVLVEVRLRPGIADPQGATIERALPALGFEGVHDVQVGKAFRFTVEAPDESSARQLAEALSQRLLANPVIEATSVAVGP